MRKNVRMMRRSVMCYIHWDRAFSWCRFLIHIYLHFLFFLFIKVFSWICERRIKDFGLKYQDNTTLSICCINWFYCGDNIFYETNLKEIICLNVQGIVSNPDAIMYHFPAIIFYFIFSRNIRGFCSSLI